MMGRNLAMVLLYLFTALSVFAAAPAPAAADFVYLAPAGTGSGLRTVEAPGPGASGPDTPGPGVSGPGAPWRVAAGESLRAVLARWGGRAGVEVLMLTDRHYVLGAGRAWRGSFAEAVASLLAALSHLPAAPAGELSADGRRLAVTHLTTALNTAGAPGAAPEGPTQAGVNAP